MPKMIVSIDEVVIKEVQITKDRTTLGRRPYNDIVIDNLAVSGEHAVILMTERQGCKKAATPARRRYRDWQVQNQVRRRWRGRQL
jgi:hypothetical protein